MKKQILIFLTLMFTNFIFCQEVTITFHTNYGEVLEKNVDENTRLLIINEYFIPQSQNYEEFLIDDISGLEKLQNLQVLQINDVYNIINYDFLRKLNYLEELYIQGAFVSSLNFIEEMSNLEIIDLTIYVLEEDLQEFKNQMINLENLLFVKKIDYHVSVINEEELEDYSDIPHFYNVQNQPILNIGRNQIYTLTAEQIENLTQYSVIYLWPNPIIENPEELEKLKGLNIILK